MTENKMTPEAEAFYQDYGELVRRHKHDFAHYPVFIPDGYGKFAVTIQSTPVDISDRFNDKGEFITPAN